ncbi:hypothetical protein SASPL_120223 [Salvia splendens]|uniref:Uncharacterized protein n=1 Tax=Salvia splendens TaxID=180675 RepID=A0A8X8XTV5_SALSN|nr:hypothetical protein SASPL_120223 [Salvia splendens]
MASLPARLKIQCIVFVTLWIGSSSTSSDLGELLVKSSNQQREFDFFMLSFLWPGTACLSSHGECCPSNACCRRSSAFTEFTIPECCFRIEIKKVLFLISTLLSTMKKYWPSYNCESSSNCHNGTGLFWEHEEVLREAVYVASNCEKYPLGGIVSAIEKAYHATPALACSGDAVEELRLCFSKDFKFRDCGVEIPPESSCPEYVSLPKFISSGLGNKKAKALKLET